MANPDNAFSTPDQAARPGFTSTVHTLSDGRELTSRSRPGKGPGLILIPGTWGDLESWTPLITRLPVDQAITVIELFWQDGRPLRDGPLDLLTLANAVLEVVAYAGQSDGECYDLEQDPDERHNLWDCEHAQAVKHNLLHTLQTWQTS